jgi:hypothetical protein
MKKCPLCSNEVGDYPAISRKDNKTKICSDCGVSEALADYAHYRKLKLEAQVAEIESFLSQVQGRWN